MMPTSEKYKDLAEEVFKEILSFNDNKFKWNLFSEKLPTNVSGKQIDILFCDPRWATYVRGMYTHYPDEPLKERLSEYKSADDSFYEWDSMMPTHWFPLPDKPKRK